MKRPRFYLRRHKLSNFYMIGFAAQRGLCRCGWKCDAHNFAQLLSKYERHRLSS